MHRITLLFLLVSFFSQAQSVVTDTLDRVSLSYVAIDGFFVLDNPNPMYTYLDEPFQDTDFDSTQFGSYNRSNGEAVLVSGIRLSYQSWIATQVFINLGVEYDFVSFTPYRTGAGTQNAPFLYVDERYSSLNATVGIGYDFLPSGTYELGLGAYWTGGPGTIRMESYFDEANTQVANTIERTGFANRFELKLHYAMFFESGVGFMAALGKPINQTFSPGLLTTYEEVDGTDRIAKRYTFDEEYDESRDQLIEENNVLRDMWTVTVGVVYGF
ncbi:hypothetical protein [Phaeocystidibacter luteus]|uniref:Outer membrane beta-barrel protein n=1 Tax=Phaeocystidibacter luteus TaxID=911197 RepID=A0A6N6RG11_9FLAO|nr:hypothetical protein [Phaeocystidibacter luteus]KAB2807736.1 hypothetical protein F8C67_11895 [Phaeocystidibacter luteus]